MERRSNANTLAERHNRLTTKGTKSTKESEDEVLDPTVKVSDIAQGITALWQLIPFHFSCPLCSS